MQESVEALLQCGPLLSLERSCLKEAASRVSTSFSPPKSDGFVKSRIFPFIWIPAYAGMTIKHLISIRYTIRHTRECGYPEVKKTFYEFIKPGSGNPCSLQKFVLAPQLLPRLGLNSYFWFG